MAGTLQSSRRTRLEWLDKDGNIVSHEDPDKFEKAVHMSSIHLDAGMHCVDCHFEQDTHGNGHLYGEVASAIEITARTATAPLTNTPHF